MVPTDVEESAFTNNRSGAFGGAIYARLTIGVGNPPSFTDTLNLDTFSGNRSQADGGGVDIYSDSADGSFSVVVTNDTFNGNKALGGSGGGLLITQFTNGAGTGSTATLTNDTFYQNRAGDSGGGVALSLQDLMGSNKFVSASLTSLTVYQNWAATDSGGLWLSSTLTKVVNLDNNIFSGNTVTAQGYNGPVDVTLANNNPTMFNTEQYNLVGTSDKALFTGTGDLFFDNPGLAPGLASNGPPTGYPLTLALQRSSPGYQKGDWILASQSAPLSTDERGFQRTFDPFRGVTSVSMGAEDPDALAVQQGQSATSVRSTMNPSLPGQPVTLIALVAGAGGIPTGTVIFYDGMTQIGSGTLDSYGNATLTTASLTLGNHNIIAQYSGDSNFTGSSGSLTQVISQQNSSFMSLSSSATNATLNQSVTFTATANGSNGMPTGSVTFLDGTTILGSSNLDGTGKATFTTSTLSLGSHTITAVYNGDATYGSNSALLNQPIMQGGVSTTLSVNANPAQPGQPVTFTATLTYNNAAGTPTGSVTFLDGTTVLGTGSLSQVGSQMQATFTTSTLSSGSHAITAVYGGDDIFMASSSSLAEIIGQASAAGSTTFVSASPNPALLGQSVTLTATVSGMSGTPTGTVTFFDGTTELGIASLSLVGGHAQPTFTTSTLGLGYNDIVAVYSGDGTYAGSAGSLSLPVNQGGTSTSLTSSANPSPVRQPVTFTATVMAMGMGVPTPTGIVSFFDGTTFLGNATLTVVNGQVQATFATSALGVGNHHIIAIYSGDNTFAESESFLDETISS